MPSVKIISSETVSNVVSNVEVIKSHLKQSYDKQNLPLEIISMKFMKFAKGSFHKFHIKWPLMKGPWFEPPHDKTNKMTVHPAKTQISLGIWPVWSESSLCAQWVAKDPSFLHANSEDSDQTGRMPSLIWVFAGRTLILLVLSCRNSHTFPDICTVQC